MKTCEQFECQKLGDRKSGRHQARQTSDTVRLSAPASSPSPPLRQPVSTLEEACLHLFEASSYPLKPSLCVLLARQLPMLHHRCIGHFRACKEDGTGATLGLRQDDPARSCGSRDVARMTRSAHGHTREFHHLLMLHTRSTRSGIQILPLNIYCCTS